jgi:hypothetical protein
VTLTEVDIAAEAVSFFHGEGCETFHEVSIPGGDGRRADIVAKGSPVSNDPTRDGEGKAHGSCRLFLRIGDSTGILYP